MGGCYRRGTRKGISEKVMCELKHVRKAAMWWSGGGTFQAERAADAQSSVRASQGSADLAGGGCDSGDVWWAVLPTTTARSLCLTPPAAATWRELRGLRDQGEGWGPGRWERGWETLERAGCSALGRVEVGTAPGMAVGISEVYRRCLQQIEAEDVYLIIVAFSHSSVLFHCYHCLGAFSPLTWESLTCLTVPLTLLTCFSHPTHVLDCFPQTCS